MITASCSDKSDQLRQRTGDRIVAFMRVIFDHLRPGGPHNAW
jgi:hypothetical protein